MIKILKNKKNINEVEADKRRLNKLRIYLTALEKSLTYGEITPEEFDKNLKVILNELLKLEDKYNIEEATA